MGWDQANCKEWISSEFHTTFTNIRIISKPAN